VVPVPVVAGGDQAAGRPRRPRRGRSAPGGSTPAGGSTRAP
jgi:hypothetical protein